MANDTPGNLTPSSWIVRFAPLIARGGEVLDLACGYGRHARYLASLGYRVEAVDRDADALASLAGIAGVTPRVADLERGPWPYHNRCFEGIVVSRYLWRPLLPMLINALSMGGVLIYETFMEGQQIYGRPTDPAHLLRPGELLEMVRRRLTVVAFEQGESEDANGGLYVIQRLCARRGPPGRLPPPLG
ncbi:MAG: methyltransferase domain-containing protein [Rhodocyclaceae bacterium]|nr:methyltransferase domain-containing protein [Rhodocyclaceae bacterium]